MIGMLRISNKRVFGMRASVSINLVILTVLFLPIEANSTGIDLHWLWDNSCAECHGHSGNFSRKFLTISNGQLQGVHHVNNLRLFLHNHYLMVSEVDGIYEMLLAQASTSTRFKNECSRCHGNTAQFVRDSMIFQNKELMSLKFGDPVHRFMEHHRRLKIDDIEFFMNLLTRVANEVYRP